MEDAQDSGQDQQDEGPAGRDDERLVGERVEPGGGRAGTSQGS
jgi:hypothetical protein